MPDHAELDYVREARLFPVIYNDDAVPEIRVGVREFECIGAAPPNDHPHVYLAMGDHETILCTYCSSRFRFDPRLRPTETDPLNCLYSRPDAGFQKSRSRL